MVRLLRQLIIMGLLVGVGTAISQCHAAPTSYTFRQTTGQFVQVSSRSLSCQTVADAWAVKMTALVRPAYSQLYTARCDGSFTGTLNGTKTGTYQGMDVNTGLFADNVAMTWTLTGIDAAPPADEAAELLTLTLVMGGVLAFGLGFLAGK